MHRTPNTKAAIKEDMPSVVAETIRANDIDGPTVMVLNPSDIEALAETPVSAFVCGSCAVRVRAYTPKCTRLCARVHIGGLNEFRMSRRTTHAPAYARVRHTPSWIERNYWSHSREGTSTTTPQRTT